jgi:hypothetical protein
MDGCGRASDVVVCGGGGYCYSTIFFVGVDLRHACLNDILHLSLLYQSTHQQSLLHVPGRRNSAPRRAAMR